MLSKLEKSEEASPNDLILSSHTIERIYKDFSFILNNTKVLLGKCHINFDHMQGYFGVSSLEALSQGSAVICGIDRWNIEHIETFTNTKKLPWIIARNYADLVTRLKQILLDDDLLAEVSKYSRFFMEKYWSEKKVLEKLDIFYQSL